LPTGPSSVAAIVQHHHAIGPVVRLQLERVDDSSPFEVELNRQQCRDLELSNGLRVYVDIKRIRVFSEDQAFETEDFSI
ncbi:MAG TPA: hypothetical protein DCM86_18705, partial [Verrucomicrobiales bacterium]|nr:hypothetical protein [Verrucomicrobiales bacterium]